MPRSRRPITGVVGLRLVDPGNIVHAADTNGMIVITQLQPIAVLFTIPEDSLPQVTQKLRAGAHLPADAYNRDNSKKLASGTLMTLDNQIDNTTGTSKLKAVFDNKDNALFPQQFVNIRLLVDTLTNQLVVPNVAVQNGQQGTFVYVVDDDSKVHLKTVQVGITTETSADILSGLSDGDRVVVDGTDRLIEGAAGPSAETPENWRTRPTTTRAAATGRRIKKGDGSSRRAAATSEGGGNFKKGQGGGARSESLPDLHPAAGGDVADDGRRGAGRCRCFPATAGLGAAAGRLPDHAGPDVLPRREPGGGDVFDHRAARKAVRAGAGTDADDVDQFLWQFADHAAVFARSQHRRSRAGGAGRHQCGHDLSSHQSPGSSHLQQDESRRRAHSDAGHYVHHACRCPKSRSWRKRAWRREFPSSRAWAW